MARKLSELERRFAEAFVGEAQGNASHAAELAGYKEVTEILYIPVAPIVYLIGVMSAVTALVFAANAWRHFRGSAQPHPGASAT